MIFIDYKGEIDKNSGNEHVGARVIYGTDGVAVIFQPGVQGIDQAAWDRVKSHPNIGWDDKLKDYGGFLFEDGAFRELPTKKNGKEVDWSQIKRSTLSGPDGIIKRTVHPRVLESIRKHAVSKVSAGGGESWGKVLKTVTDHLDDVCTGFDGNKVDVETAQAGFRQAIGM